MTAAASAPATGERWFVEEHGTPGGPVHVLVHGIGVSARYLRPLALELARSSHVLVPELPGFGRTPRPADGRPASIEELAEGLARELDLRGIEQAVLTGHSMGTQVVAEAVRRHPRLAQRVVLIGPVVDPAAPRVLVQAARLLLDGIMGPPRGNVVVIGDYLRSGPRWYNAQVPAMMAYPTKDAVAALRCPVLVVRGSHDLVAPARWVRDLAAAAADGQAVEVAGAAHLVQFARPRQVAALCAAGTPVVGRDLLHDGAP